MNWPEFVADVVIVLVLVGAAAGLSALLPQFAFVIWYTAGWLAHKFTRSALRSRGTRYPL